MFLAYVSDHRSVALISVYLISAYHLTSAWISDHQSFARNFSLFFLARLIEKYLATVFSFNFKSKNGANAPLWWDCEVSVQAFRDVLAYTKSETISVSIKFPAFICVNFVERCKNSFQLVFCHSNSLINYLNLQNGVVLFSGSFDSIDVDFTVFVREFSCVWNQVDEHLHAALHV